MLEKLRAFFVSGSTLSGVAGVMTSMAGLLAHFEADYAKDGNSRDAAIDVLIEILQSEKTKP